MRLNAAEHLDKRAIQSSSLPHCYLNMQIKKSLKRKADSATPTTSVFTNDDEEPSTPCTSLLRTSNGRPIKPPKKDLPAFEDKKVRMSEQLRYCNNILKEMLSKRHYAYAWPFYTPVDAVALGLHDYHDIIKQPMDLSTIKVKLVTHQNISSILQKVCLFRPKFFSRKKWTSKRTTMPRNLLPMCDSCFQTATDTIHRRMMLSTWQKNYRYAFLSVSFRARPADFIQFSGRAFRSLWV